MSSNYSTNVFINCPFDQEYIRFLKPLLFIVISAGFNPRIALETMDSGEVRLEKIKKIIFDSKFSIHDLSLVKAKKKNDYYRMNMPFEIGLDWGCRFFNDEKTDKKALILVRENYGHQRPLSDLAGSDVKHYGVEPPMLVTEVRNWFSELGFDLKGSSNIWDTYNDFLTWFSGNRKNSGFSENDISSLPDPEFMKHIQKWLKENNYTARE